MQVVKRFMVFELFHSDVKVSETIVDEFLDQESADNSIQQFLQNSDDMLGEPPIMFSMAVYKVSQ